MKPPATDPSRAARAALAALTLQLRAAEREAEAAERRRDEPDADRRRASLEQSLAAWVAGRRLEFERETDAAQTAAAQRVLARRASAVSRPAPTALLAPATVEVEPAELVTRSVADLLRSRSVLPPRPGRGAAAPPPADRPPPAHSPYTPTPPRRPATFESSLPPRPSPYMAPSAPAADLWPPRPSEYTPPLPPRPPAPPAAAPHVPPMPAAAPRPEPRPERPVEDDPGAIDDPVDDLDVDVEDDPVDVEDDPVEAWLRAVAPQRFADPERDPEPEVVDHGYTRPVWGVPDAPSPPASAPVDPAVAAVADSLAVVVPPSGFGYQLVRLDGVPVPAFGGGPMPYGPPTGYGSPPMYGQPMQPYVEPPEKLGLSGFVRRAMHPDVAMPLVAAFLVLILLLAWLA